MSISENAGARVEGVGAGGGMSGLKATGAGYCRMFSRSSMRLVQPLVLGTFRPSQHCLKTAANWSPGGGQRSVVAAAMLPFFEPTGDVMRPMEMFGSTIAPAPRYHQGSTLEPILLLQQRSI